MRTHQIAAPSTTDTSAPQSRSSRFGTAVREINWPLVTALASVGLVRPAIHVAEFMTGWLAPSWVPFGITVVITAFWAAFVGFRNVARPFVTLLAVGVAYAALTTVLGLAGGLLLMGGVQGPAADPVSIPAILITNLMWGAVAGGLATLIRRARGEKSRSLGVAAPATSSARVWRNVLVGVLGLLGGALLGIVLTDLVGIIAGKEAILAGPGPVLFASILPAAAIAGLLAAFPIHNALVRRGEGHVTQ